MKEMDEEKALGLVMQAIEKKGAMNALESTLMFPIAMPENHRKKIEDRIKDLQKQIELIAETGQNLKGKA